LFQPVGDRTNGYWLEQTGPITLLLTVDIIDGGWHWRCLAARWGRLPIPLWLLPKSHAFKRIEGGQYLFSVSFALPLLGTFLSYAGRLETKLNRA